MEEKDKDNLSLSLSLLDADHKNEGNAVARGGGAVCNDRFLSRVWLGILIIADQFSRASAESICHALNRVGKKFDLIGLVSAVGTAAATKSLSYSALNECRFYVTGQIGPGSLGVAATLFQATEFRKAQLMAALGGMGNAHEIAQLGCPDGLYYIGLKSGSDCPVGNKVGANIVREHRFLWSEEHKEEINTAKDIEMGRDARRRVNVHILEVKSEAQRKTRVVLKADKGDLFLLGWLPLILTIGVMVGSCISCKQWFVAGLIGLGTVGMMIAVVGLRLCQFEYSIPQVAAGAPPGDCLVIDEKDSDTFHIILGEEKMIQAIFQRKIECKLSLRCKYLMLLAASLLSVYVVASVLYLPNISVSGQLLFAIANLIGFVTDLVKASKNGNLGLAKKACDDFKIKVKKPSVAFRNRTAAVAYVAKYAKNGSTLRWKKLLPCEGPVWQRWWKELAKCIDGSTIPSVEEQMNDSQFQLLQILLKDMQDGLQTP